MPFGASNQEVGEYGQKAHPLLKAFPVTAPLKVQQIQEATMQTNRTTWLLRAAAAVVLTVPLLTRPTTLADNGNASAILSFFSGGNGAHATGSLLTISRLATTMTKPSDS